MKTQVDVVYSDCLARVRSIVESECKKETLACDVMKAIDSRNVKSMRWVLKQFPVALPTTADMLCSAAAIQHALYWILRMHCQSFEYAVEMKLETLSALIEIAECYRDRCAKVAA